MDHGMSDGGTDKAVSPQLMPKDGLSMAVATQKSMRQMSFFWGRNVEILFPGWPESRLGMYILALCFVFLLAVAVELLSVTWSFRPGMNPRVARLARTSVYVLRMGLAYLVMLSVMSFNGGVFLVAVAGHAVGFFLFRSHIFTGPSSARS
ncbi:PREDICTED: copper transporter 6-like [Nelumbo nucifera]|uniref:Copper transport protein n=2 Tax=Nelumbo nucifera TaxID=4432 RepID=A0A1U7ZH20_NELNU|nr:PREDICTED: copper transporter 6-like [Nelumbo nucifera]DAD29245.1 TPA_asm: hypothetical protein HUJ06_030713 [Nelumbo nucifera]